MPINRTEYHWPYHSFRAMGTTIKAWLDADPAQAPHILMQTEALFRDVEAVLSRFNPSSELSRLNARPETWVSVSKVLWNVLRRSLEFANETDGVFDPTLLRAMNAAGYRRSFDEIGYGGHVSSCDETTEAGRWQDIQLDESRHQVWLPAGVGLDFGGIAKGYTAQWAARLIGLYGPCLIDAGGDLVAGDPPHRSEGWPVVIFAPRIEGQENHKVLVSLGMANEAMATSGIDHRRWRLGHRDAHHIIDPRTGYSANTEMLMVSALAKTGAEAEVLAKTTMIMGFDSLNHGDKQDVPLLVVDLTGKVILNDAMWQRINDFDPGIKLEIHAINPLTVLSI